MLVLGQAQQSQTGGVGQSRTALYNKHSQISIWSIFLKHCLIHALKKWSQKT